MQIRLPHCKSLLAEINTQTQYYAGPDLETTSCAVAHVPPDIAFYQIPYT